MAISDSFPTGRPHRIVVRGVNWLGDAVMTTPALFRLRERFPDSEIVLLTPSKLSDLWTGHPAVNRVIGIRPGEGLLTVALRLRRERFDLAVLFPNSPRTGLEVWLGGVRRRVGVSWPWRNGLLTDVVPPHPATIRMRKKSPEEIRQLVTNPSSAETVRAVDSPSAIDSHQLFHYLRLVGYLGANPDPVPPRLFVSPAEVEAVRAKFGFQPGSQWLGINPGAEYGPAKRWPLERFAASAAAVHGRLGCGVAVFGGLADIGLAESLSAELATAAPTIRILAGKTSLRELLAALTLCRVVLTNDTGPMHAAAAVGVPVVVPFGSTSPELTAPGVPGNSQHQLLRTSAACAPCFLRECPIDFRCMNGITVDRVVSAVIRSWN